MAIDLEAVQFFVNGAEQVPSNPFSGIDKNVLATTNVGDRLSLNRDGDYHIYVVAEKLYISEPQGQGKLVLNVAKVISNIIGG